jgi:hypothetical protein
LSGTGAAADQLRDAYGQIPLSFEANQGQTAAQVRFLARGPGYAVFLTPSQAVLRLQKPVPPDAAQGAASSAEAVVTMSLLGSNPAPAVMGLDPLAGTSNYFIGNDPSRWHSAIPTFGKVEYRDVYPGVDLVYYGNQRQLEYDLVVAPGVDPGVITWSFEGAQGLALDAQGDLVLHLGGDDVVEHAPVLYQEGPGGRQTVSGRYVLEAGGQVGFQTGPYDRTRPLTIDPTLVYSTYLGGNGTDFASAIAVDTAGNAYITGETRSTNFPTTPGVLQTTLGGVQDAFVTKLNAAGTALVYSTYLGGSGTDFAAGIAVDTGGHAYVTGTTASPNFPTTLGGFQRSRAGGEDAFVSKLNAAGTALLYSSYLGGPGNDSGAGIAVDAAGHAYVTGDTGSDFPTTPGAFQKTSGGAFDAFVAKLDTKPVPFFALGGSPGRVLLHKPDNTLVADFAPYGTAYTGPISVAVGDVNGDGIDDLITGAAVGNPHVKVYDGMAFATGTFNVSNPDASLLAQFFPYALQFNVGANVAAGDVTDGDFADIVTGATVGNPDVRVFNGKDIANHTFNPNGASLLAQWFPYALQFNVGANVAVGDVNQDGFADVVTGATVGNPDVRVFNGKDIAENAFHAEGASLLAQWFAYGLNFNVGAFVAVGDTNGDGFGDIITGASAGNPDVHVYDGKAIATHSFDSRHPESSELNQFFAYGLNFNTGVSVAAADFENTGKFDLLTGATTAPHYRAVRGNATGTLPPALFEGILSDLQGGIAVGA